jgi:hypothetical protein
MALSKIPSQTTTSERLNLQNCDLPSLKSVLLRVAGLGRNGSQITIPIPRVGRLIPHAHAVRHAGEPLNMRFLALAAKSIFFL